MKLIPARITSLREYKNLSQADFAEFVGIEQSYVSKLERGRAPNVSGIILARIASVLETSVDYLLNLTDNPSPHPTANSPALRDPRFQELASLWPQLQQQEKDCDHVLHLARRLAASPPGSKRNVTNV